MNKQTTELLKEARESLQNSMGAYEALSLLPQDILQCVPGLDRCKEKCQIVLSKIERYLKENDNPSLKLLPKYIILVNTEMRYRAKKNDYYRDAGQWHINYKFKNDKLVADCPELSWLHEQELIPISKENWKKGNKGYL
jgi:hypothetical protein